jgi:hypothetical protein
VVNKKDGSLPGSIVAEKGSDVFYRNLRDCFKKFNLPEEVFISIVLDIFGIVKQEAIVDWYKNIDVKRRIMNTIDDYLYDVAKKEKNIDLSDDDMKLVISSVISLAENNYEIFS